MCHRELVKYLDFLFCFSWREAVYLCNFAANY